MFFIYKLNNYKKIIQKKYKNNIIYERKKNYKFL